MTKQFEHDGHFSQPGYGNPLPESQQEYLGLSQNNKVTNRPNRQDEMLGRLDQQAEQRRRVVLAQANGANQSLMPPHVPDPLEIQLLAHFRALSAYGKRVAVAQMACAAGLCGAVKPGKETDA